MCYSVLSPIYRILYKIEQFEIELFLNYSLIQLKGDKSNFIHYLNFYLFHFIQITKGSFQHLLKSQLNSLFSYLENLVP